MAEPKEIALVQTRVPKEIAAAIAAEADVMQTSDAAIIRRILTEWYDRAQVMPRPTLSEAVAGLATRVEALEAHVRGGPCPES